MNPYYLIPVTIEALLIAQGAIAYQSFTGEKLPASSKKFGKNFTILTLVVNSLLLLFALYMFFTGQ